MNEQLCMLMAEIERKRTEMHEIAIKKGMLHSETVSISQKLDTLILQYQKQQQRIKQYYLLSR